MASLHQKIVNNQPNIETHILQQRDQIRELAEDNQPMRMKRGDHQHHTALEEEVHHQPITSTAPPTSCYPDAISPPSEVNPPKLPNPQPPPYPLPLILQAHLPLQSPQTSLLTTSLTTDQANLHTKKYCFSVTPMGNTSVWHGEEIPEKKSVKLWSPTTEKTMEHLSSGEFTGVEHILIHTGSNNLTRRNDDIPTALWHLAKRAVENFPTSKVMISTLLPHSDIPQIIINTINSEITRSCTHLPNVSIAQHSRISYQHLHDHILLNDRGVKLFAKNIKDTALNRERYPQNDQQHQRDLHHLQEQQRHPHIHREHQGDLHHLQEQQRHPHIHWEHQGDLHHLQEQQRHPHIHREHQGDLQPLPHLSQVHQRSPPPTQENHSDQQSLQQHQRALPTSSTSTISSDTSTSHHLQQIPRLQLHTPTQRDSYAAVASRTNKGSFRAKSIKRHYYSFVTTLIG
ncbi:hypothetical protein D5F01_LYC07701 [Larimichthys crocea]|uniref:Uncharacterized protein n=1 Tax=Larimichthys crocea TaxID=215358 RepID=A0A6G0IT91_LARCR|nr:hypothetical protein D5F01_LYC07701 [Larimichthys crocea]